MTNGGRQHEQRCRHVQEAILERFDAPADAGGEGAGAAARQAEIAAHLAICPSCAVFHARQQALDARLQAALVPPALSPTFRATLRARLREETRVGDARAPEVPAGAAPAEIRAGEIRTPHARHAAARGLEPPPSWRDALPDIVHFASFAVATLACATVLPFDAMLTLTGGASAALLTYVLLTTIRDSLEAADRQY